MSKTKTKRPKKYWVLVGHWHGAPCAILHGNYVPPFACWFAVTKEEWTRRRKEGFYARHSVRRPTAKLDPKDVIDQKTTPDEYDWGD